MSFLFIDRIARLEVNKAIVAYRNVALSDEVFRDHFAGCPVMPASLLIESLHQAATALLEVSTDHRQKAIPVMIDQAKFRTLVQPGDRLEIAVTILTSDETSAQLDAAIRVEQRLVASARLTFALRPADEFYPPHARAWVQSTYAYWLKDAQLIGVPPHPPSPP